MTINDLELSLIEIDRPPSGEPVRSLLVRLSGDSGFEGWGESTTAWRPAELSARRDVLMPALAGRSVFDIEDLLDLEVLSDPALRAAIEMASWDLAGRVVGQPVCHLFGGGYRRQVPLAVRLECGASGCPDDLVQLARELAEQGFHCQIVVSSGQPQCDLETIRTIRESVGDRAELRYDAMARFDPETARELCGELEVHGLQFVLDPLDTGDLHSIAALRRQTSVPLAIWRDVHDSSDVLAVVRSGAAAFVVVDPQQVGGMVPARKCAAVAEAAGIGAVLGGGPSLGIATAAMLQLAAAIPAFASGNECGYRQLQDDVLSEPLESVDGMITVPTAPGLGIEVDRAKVERYQVT
ncbi:MAG: mandelate racemase/muconate lactonizing enzyme family protein [Pirellulales bacterium]|nr:mandelate racemase/muconate lactonizing enzyme family protein [Pirellulales bacterium]